MPYSTQRDRTPGPLEIERAPWPAAPLNLFSSSGYHAGVFDLQWDDPAQLPVNGRFRILGVNVYRSFDSEFGPFERVTDLPVGATFWRDQTDNVLLEEDVSDQFILKGLATASGQDAPRYVFRTLHSPIVKEGSQQIPADYPLDVRVFVDGVEARVLRVFGKAGEVEIDPRMFPEVGTQSLTPAVIPGPNSRVVCYYRYTRTLLKTDLAQRVFWRVATVGIPINLDLATVQPQDLVETPLESAAAASSYEVEKLDYIWREAVRRNRWILEQGGERVKAFLRKNVGVPCPCDPSEQHKQPQNDCLNCYGTGILGGYEGPYDLIVAPDDAERKISQTELGRTVEHSYETWTGPTPILAHRDFIVKVNGERYSVGGVRFPNNRGNIIQQHFTVGHLDEKDIRYKVPVGSPLHAPAVQFAPDGPENEASSGVTNKPNIPSEQQLRGRTIAWENLEY
jgi:hypothetical protein